MNSNFTNLEYAGNLIKKAGNGIRQAEKMLKEYSPVFSNIINLCQQSIELSAKAIFKLMEIDFPEEHEIKFEVKAVGELLKKKFPKYFTQKEEIPRLIFLTQFWKNFYLLAKYGAEKLNIGPDQILTKEEAELALKHAQMCYNIASNLEIFVRQEKRTVS